MDKPNTVDGSKKVKRFAAVIYLLILSFLVGGSYLHQQQKPVSDDKVKIE